VEEDETTTTPEVITEIFALRRLVEEHSFNFYHLHSQVSVCRKIGMTIIRDIVQDSYKDGKVLLMKTTFKMFVYFL